MSNGILSGSSLKTGKRARFPFGGGGTARLFVMTSMAVIGLIAVSGIAAYHRGLHRNEPIGLTMSAHSEAFARGLDAQVPRPRPVYHAVLLSDATVVVGTLIRMDGTTYSCRRLSGETVILPADEIIAIERLAGPHQKPTRFSDQR